MEKFFQDISSPYWWVSIVIVGLLINILSSVVFKKYEQYASKHSQQKREELAAKEKIRQERISLLVGKKDEQVMQHLNINYNKQMALEYFLLGIIIINIPVLMPYFFGYTELILNTIFGLVAYYFIWKGLRLRRHSKFEYDILKEAMSR